MRCHRPPCFGPQELPSPGFEVALASEELRPLNRERPPLVGRSFHCSSQISVPPSGVSLAPRGVSTSPLASTSVPSEVFHAPSESFSVRILTSQTSKTTADNLREAFWGSAEPWRASEAFLFSKFSSGIPNFPLSRKLWSFDNKQHQYPVHQKYQNFDTCTNFCPGTKILVPGTKNVSI